MLVCTSKARACAAELRQVAFSAIEGDATVSSSLNRFSEFPTDIIEQIEVRTVSFDRNSVGDVGFIKMNVEGHELDVLAGMSRVLVTCGPNLLIEFGDDKRGGLLYEVRRKLDPLGYIGLYIDDGGYSDFFPKMLNSNGQWT